MAYASFDDYRNLYRGRAFRDSEDFDRLELRAEAVLNRLTVGRAPKYRDREKKLCLACCAVTEKLQEMGERERRLKRETVGDCSVEYRLTDRKADITELAALAEMYLFGTGLLYCGIPCEGVYV